MLTDVLGRVRNVSLPTSKPLLPLYEAIVNSIQAIDDAKITNGRIDITIFRDTRGSLIDQDNTIIDPVAFEIKDNGIGFNADNYNAFQTSDTTYKVARGGKGIGRFLWLVAFEHVEIQSQFKQDEKMMLRRFSFHSEGDGIKPRDCALSDQKIRSTKVMLQGFKEKYRRQCPKKASTIGTHIIEHCLEFFIRPNCPTFYLHDNTTGEILKLNDIFSDKMSANSKVVTFKIKDRELRILHVRLYASHAKEHQIHYCANSRVVQSEKLGNQISNLAKRLVDSDGKEFIFAGYVESDVLDGAVNSERTEFSITKDASELLAEEITWSDIKDAVFSRCASFLEPFTEPVRMEKHERISSFVANEAPMYRPLMKYITEKVDLIPPDIADDDLELKLYEAYHFFQMELNAEGKKLLETSVESDDGFEDYEKRLAEYIDRVSNVNAADLARYVCHRKSILDFLQKQLGINDNGKYRKEDRIHSIIFPMGKTSDDVFIENHNLWLIDEKLAYHEFLASDKQLRTLPALKNNSQKEPDIIVFDKACAFAASTETPYAAITLVEFKRPMRDDYSDKENPFAQTCQYITLIRKGRARTPDGRDFSIPEGMPFYCYIVCDVTPTLVAQALYSELQSTPDGQGFFGYKRAYNAFFEVISYRKMVTDAKKRNAAFFHKLGLSTRAGNE